VVTLGCSAVPRNRWARRADRDSRAQHLRPATTRLAYLTGDAFRGIALSSVSILCCWPVADIATMAVAPLRCRCRFRWAGVAGPKDLAAGARWPQAAARTAAPGVGEGWAERPPCRGWLRPDRWAIPVLASRRWSAGWSLSRFVVCAVANQATTDWPRSGVPDGTDALTGEGWGGVGWRSTSWLRRAPVVPPSFLTLRVRPATEVSPPKGGTSVCAPLDAPAPQKTKAIHLRDAADSRPEGRGSIPGETDQNLASAAANGRTRPRESMRGRSGRVDAARG